MYCEGLGIAFVVVVFVDVVDVVANNDFYEEHSADAAEDDEAAEILERVQYISKSTQKIFLSTFSTGTYRKRSHFASMRMYLVRYRCRGIFLLVDQIKLGTVRHKFKNFQYRFLNLRKNLPKLQDLPVLH